MTRIDEQKEIPAGTPVLEQTEEVLTSIQAKLDALEPDEPVLTETEEEESQEIEETTDEIEESVAETEPEESEKDESDESTEDVEAETEPKGSGPILPSSHRRTMKAYGWSEDEVDKAFEDNPKAFAETALKLHQRRIAETNDWAEVGRRQLDGADKQPDRSATQTSPQSTLPSGLQTIDVDALKKQYEGDEVVLGLIDKMAGPMNASIAALDQLMPQITQSIHATQEAEEAAMLKEVDSFFGSSDLKAYANLYGATTVTATEEQFKARFAVVREADALLVGANMQNRTLSRADALDFAHEAVSSGFSKAVVRESIKNQVKQRSKAITLKPTSKVSTQTGGKPNRQELEVRVRSDLHKLFS